MAAVIKIEIQSTGDTSKVKQDVAAIGDAAEGAGKKFSAMGEIVTGALRHIGTLAIDAVVGGLQAVGGAISDGIEDAKNYAIIAAQTEAVIKSTGGSAGVSAEHVAEYAGALSDAAGASLFGDDQIQQSTNLLLTFTEIKGTVLDAATAISVDMAQALGGEPKDAAIQLGKALNDPIKGITALTRVGVTFTEEQRAQIQAMQEAGDMAGAQGVILAELNKEFGGSAAAAAAATGGWSEFNGRMGEAKEALGTALLPLLNQFAGVLLNTVMPIVEGLAAQIGPAIAQVQTIIQGLMASFANTAPLDTFGAASTAIAAFWSSQLKPALDEVWRVLQTQVWPILQDLGTALFPLVGAAIQILAGYWNDVLVPSVRMLWEILTTIVLPVIAQLASWLAEYLPPAIQFVADFLTTILFPALHTIYDFITVNVIPTLTILFEWLQTTIPAAIQTLANFWSTVLLPAINAVWSFLQTYIIPLFTALVNLHIAVLGLAVRTLAGIWTEVLWPALNKVWLFIKDNLGPIVNWLTVTILQPLMQILSDIFFTVTGSVLPVLTKLSSLVKDQVAHAFNSLNSYAGAAAGGLSKIGEAVSGVIKWISDLAAKLNSISIPDWLQGHSPPPMADWFSYVAESVAAVNAQLPELQMNLAGALPGGGSSTSYASSSKSFTYAPNITTSGNVSAPMDLALATSLAGV